MEEQNPYRASSAAVVDVVALVDIESTTKWRRFFNWLIDKLVIYALWAVGGGVAIAIYGEPVEAWFETLPRVLDIALTWLSLLLYYSFMEGTFGFSIGKLITNTRVVDEYGRSPGFARAFLRSLCRLIPFDALSLLFSDGEVRRGWHDSLSKTYVIRRPRPGQRVGRPRHSISSQFGEGIVVQPARTASETGEAAGVTVAP